MMCMLKFFIGSIAWYERIRQSGEWSILNGILKCLLESRI